jgi:hypothetical protein
MNKIILLLVMLAINTNIYAHSHCESLFGSGCSGSEIKIKAPGTVDAPGFVPVNIDFDTHVKGGEVIRVFIDNNMTFKLEPYDEVSISKFSVRLRAVEKNGVIKVEVERYNGTVGSKTGSFSNSDSYKIPNISSSKTKHKLKSKNGVIRFLHRNKMGAKGYMEEVGLNTDSGKITITLTPYSSGEDGSMLKGFPLGGYFAIYGDFDKAKVDYVRLSND